MDHFEISPDELRVFMQEAEELLQILEDGLVRLESEPDPRETIHEIFRAAHTLKGSAATVGLAGMAELTHVMETLLDRVRHGEQTPNRPLIDALLAAVDRLRLILRASAEAPEDGRTVAVADLIERLQTTGTTPPSPPVPPSGASAELSDAATGATLRIMVRFDAGPWSGVRALQALLALEALGSIVDSRPSRETLDSGAPVDILTVTLRTAAPPAAVTAALERIPDLTIEGIQDSPAEVSPPVDEPTASGNSGAGADGSVPPASRGPGHTDPLAQTVRVDVARLDSLMALVGELVVARNRLAQLAHQVAAAQPGAPFTEGLAETTQHLERVTDQLQDEVMKSRLLPIRPIFQRLPRLVRDLAARLGKEVELHVSGEDTQLDRSVMEEITDPLVHLVRNAIDHGIEPPAERIKHGKPPAGRLEISAGQQEGWVVVTVQEDGRGIDLVRVREKAVAAGLITAEQAARLDDSEAVRLIFAPGLSTAAAVSEISGRGVGMDVVRSNIERLNGSVAVETWPGRGTRFTLRLPLTLAITRALLVRVGAATYAIPMANVGEAVRVSHSDIHALGRGEAIILRGQTVPLLRLDRLFGVTTAGPTDRALVVTLTHGTRAVGLVVDRLLGTQDLVVKPLAAMVRHLPAFAGATTLGDGSVALILDPAYLDREIAVLTQGGGR
ncbi:MAG: chemotaxis protein CheA [Chloroflexi bacterium]|nr:chemotaxis protein CheA [Chloroflexota bacterium]